MTRMRFVLTDGRRSRKSDLGLLNGKCLCVRLRFGAAHRAWANRKFVRPAVARALAAAALGAFCGTLLVSGRAEAAQSAQDFYKGKVLTVIIPYGAAGGYEYWAATLKPSLEKTLGVSRIDLVNKTGGGGLIGENYLYQAAPDGLTIGEVNGSGSIFAQLIHKPGVMFDMTKYDWIGSPDLETTMTVARAGSPYKTFADLWKVRGGKTKVVGLSAGYGGEDYVGTAISLSTFGIPYQMLLAYQGSSAAKAGLLRGDGDVASYGYSVFRPFIEAHTVIPLYIDSDKSFSKLPGTPTTSELAEKYKLSASKQSMIDVFGRAVNMGKDFAAPPGVPADRLAFLRTAFRGAAHSKGFIAAAEKASRAPGYTSPDDLQKTIALVIKNGDRFIPFLKK